MHTTIRTARLALALTVAVAACGTSSPHDGRAAMIRPAASSTTTTTRPVARPTTATDRLVPTDHGKLHIRCSGQGPVPVLLLAGWDKGADAFGPFEGSVSRHARACAYDRFGTGTSDAPATDQTFSTQVADLHAALDTAGEPGPYVVVGHSFGGAEAVTFASTYEDEVHGVALIDASPDDWPSVVCTVPAYQGGCDLMHDPARDGERLDVFPAFEQVAKVSTLGDLPLTVITAAHRSPDGITPDEQASLDRRWAAGQQRWADRSSHSTVVTVEHTGHEIYLDQPHVVLDAVVGLLP
jgi:pimeloyl-ACP methyl ester carboxylesterase